MLTSVSSRLRSSRIFFPAILALAALFNTAWLDWLSGPQSTFDVKGPVAAKQLEVFYVTLWVTGIVFILVASLLAYATFKFRVTKDTPTDAPPPPQGHGNPLIELSLIGLSVLALVFIAVPTLKAIWYDYDVPAAQKDQAYEVKAIGLQWWFRFEYPSEQIPDVGPLTTGNELVIPAGRPIRITLRTTDVIHSFWVPKLAGKVDMIPNRGNHLWLQADEPGYFWGQCAEYCGESHAVMRFRVIALAPAEFAAWVEHQKTAARVVAPVDNNKPKAQFASYALPKQGRNLAGYSEKFDADPMAAWKAQQLPDADEDPILIAEGKKLFTAKTCSGCHMVREPNGGGGNLGPDLTHIGSRTTIAAGLLENTKENLHRWLTHPNDVKPGNIMYKGGSGMLGYIKPDENKKDHMVDNFTINDDEARALVAYLHSLK